MTRAAMTLERFRDVVDEAGRAAGDGCWLWPGGTNKAGYGQVRIDGRQQGAHRLVAHLFHGLDLADRRQHALHECDVKQCVNPAHILVGTARRNLGDAARRGLLARVLTPEDVDRIRTLLQDGWTMRRIAAEIGCSKSMVHAISVGRTWKHRPVHCPTREAT